MRPIRPLVAVFVIALVMIVALPAVATFTPGFYKNKGADLWDDSGDGIVTGAFGCDGSGFIGSDVPGYSPDGMTYYEIVEQSNAKDMTYQLARHTISAQLNLAFGACNAVWGDPMQDLIDWSLEFLASYQLGDDPDGAARSAADHVKTCLDLHNNIPDGWTEADYLVSDAYACYVAFSAW